jgi:hypothetical protein
MLSSWQTNVQIDSGMSLQNSKTHAHVLLAVTLRKRKKKVKFELRIGALPGS